MWAKHDWLSKGVLSRVLGPLGEVATQHEISGEVQAADVWFQPAAGRDAARAQRGVLGRMVEEPCLIEPFHATPSEVDVRGCMSKQLNLWGMLVREAAGQARRGAARDPLPVPRLWILSAGRPEQTMRAFALAPMAGWPPGFWEMGPPRLRVHLVVLRDLPETRDTLVLRLMGRGRTFGRAMHELFALPENAWERGLAIPQLVVAYRMEITNTAREGEMNYADELLAVYDQWEARIKREGERLGWEKGEQAGRERGEQAGQRKALRATLCTLYEARFGALLPAVQEAIEGTEDIGMLQQWVACFATRTAEEIAVLVRGREAGGTSAS